VDGRPGADGGSAQADGRLRKEGPPFCEQKEAKKLHSALRALAASAVTPQSPPGAKPGMKVFARFFQKAPLPFFLPLQIRRTV
jgi:hypothetical protein